MPRTNAQVFAVRNLHIPADVVRKGIETLEQYKMYQDGTNINEKKELLVLPKAVQAEAETIEVKEEVAEEIEEINVEQPAEMTLEDVQAKYLEKFNKIVPARYRNDVERIVSKLNQ